MAVIDCCRRPTKLGDQPGWASSRAGWFARLSGQPGWVTSQAGQPAVLGGQRCWAASRAGRLAVLGGQPCWAASRDGRLDVLGGPLSWTGHRAGRPQTRPETGAQRAPVYLVKLRIQLRAPVSALDWYRPAWWTSRGIFLIWPGNWGPPGPSFRP